MATKEIEIYYPKSNQEWRQWLEENHLQKEAVWVVFYKKSANQPTVTWTDAVDEALCFGWIDSIKKKLDTERSIQFFSRRKPNSTWSKINKQKVIHLVETAKMTPAGLACIDIAKQNGWWEILDSVEALTIPQDLENALNTSETAMHYFSGLSKSVRKMMLQWLVLARRPETRQKRIKEIVALAAKKQKPKQF